MEILDRGFDGMHNISIGVVNLRFPLDAQVGQALDSESIGYHTGEGAVYRGRPRGQPFGERCDIGDRVGKRQICRIFVGRNIKILPLYIYIYI